MMLFTSELAKGIGNKLSSNMASWRQLPQQSNNTPQELYQSGLFPLLWPHNKSSQNLAADKNHFVFFKSYIGVFDL